MEGAARTVEAPTARAAVTAEAFIMSDVYLLVNRIGRRLEENGETVN
jgi:hypothetical protein